MDSLTRARTVVAICATICDRRTEPWFDRGNFVSTEADTVVGTIRYRREKRGGRTSHLGLDGKGWAITIELDYDMRPKHERDKWNETSIYMGGTMYSLVSSSMLGSEEKMLRDFAKLALEGWTDQVNA